MSIETKKYTRNPFVVDAVQVTTTNFDAIVEWVGGERKDEGKTTFIEVPVKNPLNIRQTRAFVGDWVLSANNGFKVYTNKAFLATFTELDPEDPNQGKLVFDHEMVEVAPGLEISQPTVDIVR